MNKKIKLTKAKKGCLLIRCRCGVSECVILGAINFENELYQNNASFSWKSIIYKHHLYSDICKSLFNHVYCQ